MSSHSLRNVGNLLEYLQQRRFGDRLAQEFDRSRRPCPTLLVVAGAAGEEHDRDACVALGEATLDLETIHARHADVQHQTCGPRCTGGAQELLARTERLSAIPEGADQPAGRLADRG